MSDDRESRASGTEPSAREASPGPPAPKASGLEAGEDPAPFGAMAPSAVVARLIAMTRGLPEGWVGMRLSFLIRRLALAKLGRVPVDAEALGARFRLTPYDNVCERRILFTPQYFDAVELATLRAAMHETFRFVDVGANVGAYSLAVAAAAGPRARILAIEPQTAMIERMAVNVRLNRFATIKALALAAADQEGDLTLFIDHDNRGQSSLRRISAYGPEARSVVRARPLLAILEDEGFDRIDALKIDVGGAEDLVLAPFLDTAPLDLLPRIVILEDSRETWSIDLVGRLGRLGYGIVEETRNNLVFLRRGA
jgi:FkbM family methyltransferase